MAKQNAVAEPEKIVDFVKREMGKSKAQFHREFNGKIYSAEELSALIIKKLKNDAEKYLGESVTDAVITVPAYFNDAERTATLHAGQLAGLNVLQVINEPTAAALAYGLDKLENNQTVFVFDLGGGTFDVTIMRIENHHIRMLASNGDHRLGGKDWDDVIVNWVAEEFDKVHGENPLLDLQSYQDLYNRALTAKIQLSSRQRTTIVHSYNGKSVKLEMTREDFENRCRHLLEKCKTICEIVMQEAGLNWSQIDRILLTGGMTRMPSVRDMIGKLSNVPVADDVSPDEAVAIGAAVQGVLSLLGEEDAAGARVLPAGGARTIFQCRRSLDQGHEHHHAHPRRGALGRCQGRGIRLPDDPENDAGAGGDEKLLWHGKGEHEERHRARGGRGEHRARRMHAARDLRYRIAALPAQRLAGGIDLHLQREPGARGHRRSLRSAEPGLDRAQYRPVGERDRNGDGGSFADQGGLNRPPFSQFKAWRYRIRYPTIRLAGTAGRITTRRTITSASASTSTRTRASNRSRTIAGRLLVWWQKKLPLKNQPSNPAAQMLRGGLDEAPMRLAEARTELLNPESRARLDAELRTGIVAAAVVEFKKILSFVLSEKKLTEEGERRLYDAGREVGLGDDEIKVAIDAEVERLGAVRVINAPPAPVARETGAAPSNGATNGTNGAGDPFGEFRRILRMSRLALDGEEMTDDQRDAMCNVGESLGLTGGQAEDLIDEYLDEMDGLPPSPSPAARTAVIAAPVKPKSIEVGKPVIKPCTINTSPLARAQEKQKYANFTNSIGCEMLLVTSGQFVMGSIRGEASPQEQPVTRVTVGCFYMARFPVTNGQYEAFEAAHRAKRAALADERHPVIYVSSQQAEKFCQWLTQREGRKYRLPTEAEWEYAARGLEGRVYPWGDELNEGYYANFADSNTTFPWRDTGINDGFVETAPVGSYPRGASPFGIEDLSGNVFEWCLDCFEPYRGKDIVNRRGTTHGTQRIYRGGSWRSKATSLRASARHFNMPNYASSDVGFRLVCEAE